MALTVSRKRLLESPHIILSGDRYRETAAVQSKWPMVKLGEVVEINRKSCDPKTLFENGTFIYLDISAVENGSGKVSFGSRIRGVEAPSRARRMVKQGDILLSTVRPNLQAFAYLESVPSDAVASTGFAVLTPHPEKAAGSFLYAMCFSIPVMKQMTGRMGKGAYPSITQSDIEEITIPLPPLEEQERIVAELEGYRKVIEGARQVLANYKPTIRIDPKWPTVTLSNVCESITDGDHQPPPKSASGVPFVTITNINDQHQIDFTKTFFVPDSYYEKLSESRKPRRGDILYTVTGSYGIPVLIESDLRFCFQRHIGLIRPSTKVGPRFLTCLLASPLVVTQADKTATGAAQKTVSLNSLRSFVVPLPPLSVQHRIVADLVAERKLVEANRELIARFEQKIQAKLSEIWGDEVP